MIAQATAATFDVTRIGKAVLYEAYEDAKHAAISAVGDRSGRAKALKDLEKTGRPMVILVGADWCPACQVMKETTIPKLHKTGKLKQVAFTMVNVDKNEKLASKLMRGGTIPQLIVYRKTPKGWFRSQITGAASVAKVGGVIDKAVAAQKIALGKLVKPVTAIVEKDEKTEDK